MKTIDIKSTVNFKSNQDLLFFKSFVLCCLLLLNRLGGLDLSRHGLDRDSQS